MRRKLTVIICSLVVLCITHVPHLTATSAESFHIAVVDVDVSVTFSSESYISYQFTMVLAYWNPMSLNQTLIYNYYNYYGGGPINLDLQLEDPSLIIYTPTTITTTYTGPQYTGEKYSSGVTVRNRTTSIDFFNNFTSVMPKGNYTFSPNHAYASLYQDTAFETLPGDYIDVTNYFTRISVNETGLYKTLPTLPIDWGAVYEVNYTYPESENTNDISTGELVSDLNVLTSDPKVLLPTWSAYILSGGVALASGILIAYFFERKSK